MTHQRFAVRENRRTPCRGDRGARPEPPSCPGNMGRECTRFPTRAVDQLHRREPPAPSMRCRPPATDARS